MSLKNLSVRVIAGWLLAASTGLAVWNCGSSDAPGLGSAGNVDGGSGMSGSPQGGGGSGAVSSSGGAGGRGAGAAGNAGSAGTSTGSVSMRAACRAYLMAGCIRRAECGAVSPPDIGSAMNCAEALLDRCPDYTFSPGSARTADALFACADDWKTWSCVKVVQGTSPPCGLPGTRKAGDPCVFPSQCQSLNCSTNGNPATCGTCRALAPSGGQCDGVNTVCPDGESCIGTQCVTQTAPTPTEVAVPLRRPGEACTFGDQCWIDSNCIMSDPNDSRNGTCTAVALPGEPCSKLAGSQRTTCWLEGSCGADGLCGAQTACTGGVTCTSPQFCACSAGSCTCRRPREEGASCAPPGVPCVAGLECRAGVCAATDALTIYAAACGGP